MLAFMVSLDLFYIIYVYISAKVCTLALDCSIYSIITKLDPVNLELKPKMGYVVQKLSGVCSYPSDF